MSGSNIVPLRPQGAGDDGMGLPPGGDGPDDPRMEARVAKLEEGLASVSATLARIEKALEDARKEQADQAKALARLDGRVSQLPTTLQLIGFILAVLAIAGVTRVFVG